VAVIVDPAPNSCAEINPKSPVPHPFFKVGPFAAARCFVTKLLAWNAAISQEAAMPTYIVGDIHISDPASYQAHLPRALATIARFGGRVVAGGGKIDLLEGDPMPGRIFIIEFPTADAARRWYQSDDYQEALKTRLSASSGRVFLIEGNEISSAVVVAGLDAGKN
jgi:uncharacterized protein (DUF1330 family)